MYLPSYFAVEDRRELLAFMRQYPFASITTAHNGHLTATHAPLAVRERGQELSLIGHFARANEQWQALQAGCEALVIFNGPHAYVSPSLYESKLSVPTWNYAVVHAYGRATMIDSEPAVMELVEDVDPRYREQWDSLPDKFRTGMLSGLVAFEIRVAKLEGKFKLSQNRPATDQARVAESFAGTELGDLMKRMKKA
jgi:transcriptional regulator